MKNKNLSTHIKTLLVLLVVASTTTNARANAFSFTGFIQYQQSAPVPGISIGDQFYANYTFDPLTVGQSFTPFDNTLDTEYWAVTSWSVTIPTKGITLSGLTGEIGVGNNTSWYKSDRYVVTMFPDVNNPQTVSGHTLAFFQLDLFDFGMNVGADMFQSSALPLTPPNLALIAPGDERGRFVFQDASFQNRITSITAVPEPSALALIVIAGVGAATRRRNHGGLGSGARTVRDDCGGFEEVNRAIPSKL